MKKSFIIIIAAIFCLLSQTKAQGFSEGSLTAGPTLGVSYGFALGAQLDYGLTNNWSIGGDIVYTTYKQFYNYNLLGMLLAGAYHFMPNNEWDPYVKGGLGFFNWTNDAPQGWNVAYSSGVGFVLQAGCRYYFNDNIAARASLGFPYYVGLGVDFKIK